MRGHQRCIEQGGTHCVWDRGKLDQEMPVVENESLCKWRVRVIVEDMEQQWTNAERTWKNTLMGDVNHEKA